VDDDRALRRLVECVKERRVLLEVRDRLVDDLGIGRVEDRVLAGMGGQAQPEPACFRRDCRERLGGLLELAAIGEIRQVRMGAVRDRLARQPVHRDVDPLEVAEHAAEQVEGPAEVRTRLPPPGIRARDAPLAEDLDGKSEAIGWRRWVRARRDHGDHRRRRRGTDAVAGAGWRLRRYCSSRRLARPTRPASVDERPVHGLDRLVGGR
jgi:hypothetical protein